MTRALWGAHCDRAIQRTSWFPCSWVYSFGGRHLRSWSPLIGIASSPDARLQVIVPKWTSQPPVLCNVQKKTMFQSSIQLSSSDFRVWACSVEPQWFNNMSSSVATPLQLYTNELLAIFANQFVFIGDVCMVCCVQINFFCSLQSSLSRPGTVLCPVRLVTC